MGLREEVLWGKRTWRLQPSLFAPQASVYRLWGGGGQCDHEAVTAAAPRRSRTPAQAGTRGFCI